MGKPLHTRRIPETFVQLLYEYLDARGMAAETVLGQARPVPHVHGLGSLAIERWAQLLERASRHQGVERDHAAAVARARRAGEAAPG